MVTRAQRGFSFTEILIAMALLATLGSSLLGGVDRERAMLAQSFDELQAQTAAQDVFELLRADRTLLTPGATSIDGLPAGLHGTRSIEAVTPGLFTVRVRIEGGELLRPFELETRVARAAR